MPLLDILIVNEGECRFLAAMPGAGLLRNPELIGAAARLELRQEQALLVTLGSAGVAIVRDGAVRRVAGENVEVVDTTGAGDCFCGYLAAGLVQGISLENATRSANIAASLAVQSWGAARSVPASPVVAAILEARSSVHGR